MKATIAGARVSIEDMRSAAAATLRASPDVRARSGRSWVELPLDVPRATVDGLARQLGCELVVIEVEMPLGGRGDGLFAARSVRPHGGEEDLSEEAREVLHEWLSDAPGGGFDEDQAVGDLAWALIDGGEDEDDEPRDRELPDLDERWARALAVFLLETGGIELRGNALPIRELADHLRDLEEEEEEEEDSLGARLLEALIESARVDEVHVDEEQLATAARQTRPTR